MNGYAVTIRADITPALDGRQIDAVAAETGGTVAYNEGTGILRYGISTPDPDATWLQVLQYAADTVTRAVQLAGATASIREARALAWDDYQAETFRPSTPRGGLAGRAEAAEILGVSPQRITELRKENPAFPRPVQELRAGPVWDQAEIERFGRGWDRKAGRPRKNEA